MSFDTLVKFERGIRPLDPLNPTKRGNDTKTGHIFMAHKAMFERQHILALIDIRLWIANPKYSELNPPEDFPRSNGVFSIYYASSFEILNDRKKIVEALVEQGVLSKDAIEAFADDVPTRVPEPVRDNSLDTRKVRATQYLYNGTVGAASDVTSGNHYGGYQQYHELYRQHLARNPYQRGDGG